MPVTAEALRLQARLDAQVQAITDDQTRILVAAWVAAWAEVSGDLQDTLVDMLADTGKVTRAMMLRSVRLRAVLGQIADRLEDLAAQATVTITSDLAQVVADAADLQGDILAAQLPNLPGLADLFDRLAQPVSDRALDAIVRRSTEQITALTRPLSASAYAAVRRELIRAVAAGAGPRETAARMVRRTEGRFNGGLTRALVISRTETLDAHRAAAAAGQAEHTDVLTGWVWLAHLDTRTCPACLARHGTVHDADQAGPEGHQQCVLPGAVVSGPRAEASTTRWFAGEIIDIETRSGRVLSVTPNHPILTPQGWIPAGLLREGDHVVAGTGADGPPVGGRPDNHQIPALIEDVAQTLGGSLPVDAVRVPTAPEDFHGDGAGSEVHVVRTNRLLRGDRQPTRPEFVGQTPLVIGDVGLKPLPSGRRLALPFEGDRHPSSGCLSGLHYGAVLLRRTRRGHGPVHLSGAPLRHTCGIEPVVDGTSRAAVGPRQGVDRVAAHVPADDLFVGQVALSQQGSADASSPCRRSVAAGSPVATLDQDALESRLAYPMPSRDSLAAFAGEVVQDSVLHVRRRRWQGHVYNLQTATGWFLANGILTHNCRCARMPRVKPWAELGFDVDEPADVVPDAQAWFESLSVEQQAQLLGRRRWELLTSGEISWSDLATLRKTDGWRDSWTVTPLAVLQRGGGSGSRLVS